jgi:hypothetical protein
MIFSITNSGEADKIILFLLKSSILIMKVSSAQRQIIVIYNDEVKILDRIILIIVRQKKFKNNVIKYIMI